MMKKRKRKRKGMGNWATETVEGKDGHFCLNKIYVFMLDIGGLMDSLSSNNKTLLPLVKKH